MCVLKWPLWTNFFWQMWQVSQVPSLCDSSRCRFTGAKPHSCRHCSERFMWLHQLKRHLLQSHNEGTWLTCHICQKKFVYNHNFKLHILRHEGVKPYVCSECPKRFYTSSHLKRHQMVHSDIRGFGCGLCAKSFKCKQYVVIHFKRCASRLGFSDM